jgi:hypothetical protein
VGNTARDDEKWKTFIILWKHILRK